MSNEETKEQEGTVVETTPTVLETVAEAAGTAIGAVESAVETVTETVTEAAATVTNYFAPEEEAEEAGRNERKTRIGLVASNKMDKTVVIAVQRKEKHRIYKKYIQKTTKYYAHDEGNKCNIGDIVEITYKRPLSKTKRWEIVNIK